MTYDDWKTTEPQDSREYEDTELEFEDDPYEADRAQDL